METVAVTHGNGLIGRAVVQRLRVCDRVKEIRVLDCTTACPDVTGGLDTPVRCISLHFLDEGAVERALAGCTTVIHCSNPPIPTTYGDKEQRKTMWNETLNATEVLVDKILSRRVARLVYVGDAYSALPIEDNYGLGEDMFREFPRNYMLGEFGEARLRAEMYARTAVERNASLNGMFLRATHVHGEGESELIYGLNRLASKGTLPYVEGERRGMHQFIYADNLAAIVEKAVFGLLDYPERFSGEIVYCMDDTAVYPFRDFLSKRIDCPSFSSDNAVSFTNTWFHHYVQYIRHSLGLKVAENTMSYPAFRLFFEKTVGFSDKKLRLLMDHRPEVPQEKAFELSSQKVRPEPMKTTMRTILRSG